MPQGKVIAVKPNSTKGGSDENGESTWQPENRGTANGQRLVSNLVYIEEIKNNPNEQDKVFWYEDTSLSLVVGIPVNFKINNQKTRRIKEAVDVKKDKSFNPSSPKSLVSKVALFASLLLIASVIIEGEKHK